MGWKALQNLFSDHIHALPIAVLYITDRCNSRCASCDYWRHGERVLETGHAIAMADRLKKAGTRYVLLSGGEPLQHPEWATIAGAFRSRGMRVALATSGLLLPRHADAVAACIDELYVSLDGATPQSYRSIRGVEGFAQVKQGIESISPKLPVIIRTTVQRSNYRELCALAKLTRSWGAARHSFFPVDLFSHAAFAREAGFDRSMALAQEDLDPFRRILESVEVEFKTGRDYIVESRTGLLRLHEYFSAQLGVRKFPPVRCNAPKFSAVIQSDGSLKPCFFLPTAGRFDGGSLLGALNTEPAIAMRTQQRRGERPECVHCVCPSYKRPMDLLGGI